MVKYTVHLKLLFMKVLLMCVYMCVFVHFSVLQLCIYGRTCTSTCMSTCGGWTTLDVMLSSVIHPLWNRVSHWLGAHQLGSGCPGSPWDSLVHTMPALGLQAKHHALLFRWVLGNQTQLLLLVCRCLTDWAIAPVPCQHTSYFSCLFLDALAPSYRKTCLSPLSYSGVFVE